ncbi:membrane protein [Nitratireductor aquibiodomus]|uniref:membrane protein n=1 Tax=Nitratireductor aquibiodomus TaxID=204799 RepID=UPI0004688EEF|nr:membrane protein [Nitratireductor aquibiodomus]
MDRTVPTGAALLLAFVYETETSRTPPECYEVIYGHRQDRLSKPLTRMTVDEVIAAQRAWSRSHGSSAAGAPQFIRKTLIGLKEELGLRGSQILDANLQDRLAYHLLIRRGYHQFVNGEIDRTEFGRRLAGEWASFPVLDATRGAHRHVQRGQSYYAGDSLNKALVAPAKVEAVLDKVYALANTKASEPEPRPLPVATPEPVAKSKRFWTWLLTGIGAPFAALGNLHPAAQIAIVALIAGFAIYAISSMPAVRKKLGLAS